MQNRIDTRIPVEEGAGNPKLMDEIIALTQSCGDAEIHRQFSRKGLSVKDFLRNIPEELLMQHIRPFIDRQGDRLLKLALQQNIPVYLYEGSPLTENRLIIGITPAEPWFCFKKTENGTNYLLEIYQDNTKINLHRPGNSIIFNDPCWFRSGRSLHYFPDGFNGKKIRPFLTKEVVAIPASAERKYFETFILKTIKTGQVKAVGFTVQEPLLGKKVELSIEIDWQGRAILVVYFWYGEKRIMAGKSQKSFVDMKMGAEGIIFNRINRDNAWESHVFSKFNNIGLSVFNENTLILPGASGVKAIDLYRMAPANFRSRMARLQFCRKNGLHDTPICCFTQKQLIASCGSRFTLHT